MHTLQSTRRRIVNEATASPRPSARQAPDLANAPSLYKKVFAYNTYNRDRWVASEANRIPAGSRVIDVGAGRGRYRPLFSHCEYRAQDFAQEKGTVGEYTPLDYESDIVDIPVDSASFDAVLCTEVLEHVPEPILAVNEMARILRPGGTLLLSAPLGSLLHQEPFHFYGGYTPHWYQKVLSEAGLEITSLERNEGFFHLFAQEGQRFSAYLDPRRLWNRPWLLLPLGMLWFLTLPIFRILLPLMAVVLDRLELESISTAGYHVVARKAAS